MWLRRTLRVLILLLSLCPSAEASRSLSDLNWYFIPENKNTKYLIDASTSLKLAIDGREGYRGTIVTQIPANLLTPFREPALLFPAIGGVSEVRLDFRSLDLSEKSSSDAYLIPILSKSLTSSASISLVVKIDGKPWSFYQGFWKGSPVVGEFQELLQIRDQLRATQFKIPALNIIYLFFGSLLSLGFYVATGRRLKYYLTSGLFFLASIAFYISLTGLILDFNYPIGTFLHMPLRLLLSWGVLEIALIEMVIKPDKKAVKLIRLAFALACVSSIVLGFFFPKVQDLLVPISTVAAFSSPVVLLMFYGLEGSKKKYIFTAIYLLCLLLQVVDSIKQLFDPLVLKNVPFFNRYTFSTVFLSSIVCRLFHISHFFIEQRVHLFKAKSYARTVLHAAKDGLTHDNVDYFLKVTSKICGYTRVSLAQRHEDGVYRIVKIYGSKFDAIGSAVNPDRIPCLNVAIAEGRVAFGAVQSIAEGWSTHAYAVVPVPEKSNPTYILLLSDPRKSNLNSQDVVPYLSQISSALWTNLERTKEHHLRIHTEKKFSSIVRKMDPNLFEFVSKNLDRLDQMDQTASDTRGIVFFDQKAYSTMTEKIDDITMGRFSQCVGEWVTRSAAKYGARISNFAGDAFLLETFCIGDETEVSIADRTLSLVWSLAQTIGDLNQILMKEGFSPVTFRFGAHFGRVTAANLDFIHKGLSNSIGDTVNIAARLQSLAKPGTIYISDELAKYTTNRFEVSEVPKQFVKGRSKRIGIYSLIGKVDEAAHPEERSA